MASIRSLLGCAIVFSVVSLAAPSEAFDKENASSVLAQVDLTKCRGRNAPRGEGHVKITFQFE